MHRFLKPSVIVAGVILSSLLSVHPIQAQQKPQGNQQQQNSQPEVEDEEGEEQENRIRLPRRPGEKPNRDRTPLRRPPSRGGIEAKITLTPTCSVVGPSSDCAARPYVGPIRIQRLTNRDTSRFRVIRTQTDPKGQLKVRLEPGLYTIQPEGGSFPITAKETVRILPQRFKSVNIVFQGNVVQQIQRTLPQQPQRTLPGQR